MTFLNFELLFFDYLVLILTVIIIIFSFWKGFINSILGLLTWVGSVFITIYAYQYVSDFFSEQLLNINFLQRFEQFVSIISIIISIPIIFLISLFILKRIRKFLNSDLDKQILGIIFDKFFGTLYGIIFSYIIFSSLLYLTDDNNFKLLSNLHIFLIENSNLLFQISEYNNNILEIYTNTDQ
tara:strand:+ start:438 stop:983 length:546 start_codon:yes stop_codon:yes gene_type:complete